MAQNAGSAILMTGFGAPLPSHPTVTKAATTSCNAMLLALESDDSLLQFGTAATEWSATGRSLLFHLPAPQTKAAFLCCLLFGAIQGRSIVPSASPAFCNQGSGQIVTGAGRANGHKPIARTCY